MTRLALSSLTILQSMPQFDLKGIFSSLCSGMQRLHFLPEKGATDWYSELVSGRPSLQAPSLITRCDFKSLFTLLSFP